MKREWYFVNEYDMEGGQQLACHGMSSRRCDAMNKLLRVEPLHTHSVLHIEPHTVLPE